MNTRFLLSILPLCLLHCASNAPETISSPQLDLSQEFKDYWYAGVGELNSYDLQQARYNEVYEGEAVLVYATEDFSKSKQVKVDNPANKGDAVSVLKVNANRTFNTGIYPYSTLQSVFTPIHRDANPNTLKISTSIQEWCGHTYTQLNLQTYKYKVTQHSYFEGEADQEFQIDRVFLEDEIWTLLRISPDLLPEGDIHLLPSTLAARFQHTEHVAKDATATKSISTKNDQWMDYTITYSDNDRVLTIYYNKEFPYLIEGWEETFTQAGKKSTTTATRKKTIQLDYWNYHRNQDIPMRQEQLGLD